MKADRTVIVFGVFLFLVGLAVAWNGYGYVQIERGWTMVISGTIGFCTGLILIALGLALAKLEAIASSTAKSALFLAKVKNSGALAVEANDAAPPAEPEASDEVWPFSDSEPEPRRAAAEKQAEGEEDDEIRPFAPYGAPGPATAVRTEHAEPASAEPPESFAVKPPLWMTRASTLAATYAAARSGEASAETRDESRDETQDKAAAETTETAAKLPVEDDGDWLEQAIADEVGAAENFAKDEFAPFKPHSEPGIEPAREAEPFGAPAEHAASSGEPALPSAEPVQHVHEEQEVDEIHEFHEEVHEIQEFHEEPAPGREFAPWLRPEPADEAGSEAAEPATEAAHEPEPEPEQVVEPEPAPAPEPPWRPEREPELESDSEPAHHSPIIGSYDAHGTHYTMYADGSIDAETVHGVYRFASMEELKRFIEKS